MNDGKQPDSLGKASEFFMAAPVIIGYVRRPDYVIELANPDLLQVWGRGPEVIGLPLTTAIPELAGQGFIDLLDQVCQTGEPYYAYAYPIVLNRTGREDTYYFDFIYKPYYGNGPKEPATGVISVGHDVTAQVRARVLAEQTEADLQQKVEERTMDLQRLVMELQKANQNLERFTYAASHDLKAPVRKIQLFTQTLYDRLHDALSEEDRKLFSRILAGSRRMTTLIDDLLNYAHVTSDQALTELVDLNTVLQLVIEDLESDIERKKAVISLDSLPTVSGNARQLQQLFINLISNALKYAHALRTPHIRITCTSASADHVAPELQNIIGNIDRYFWIKVIDNGIGFDQADSERIFQVFVRLHTEQAHSGSGVGLAIVQKVVENHNGYIYATSVQGEGSVFNVLLPKTAESG